MSAGTSHVCGLTTGGVAYCWGSNGSGELGNETTTNSSTPVPVAGGLTFASLSAGWSATCGVTTGGVAYCWGTGDGVAGNASNVRSRPVAVPGGLRFASIRVGWMSTVCGVTTDSRAYCWGDNVLGELGNGATTDSWGTPVAVTGGLTFATVSPGEYVTTCGVTTGGVAYCWGDNGSNQLGNGPPPYSSSTPIPVSGGLMFDSLSVGSLHACGLTTRGVAYCWGYNSGGQLGNGTTVGGSTPVRVVGGQTFVSVGAGDFHSCGLTAGGAAYCWGGNWMGQLGTGDTTPTSRPVLVSGGLTFAQLSVSHLLTCGVTTRGAAYCWGYNGSGQLGNGAITNSSTPVMVATP